MHEALAIDADYIYNHTVAAGDCLLWTGTKLRSGYGRYYRDNARLLAHRAMYMLHNGNIPKGYVIHHLCENKGCVKLEHLSALPSSLHLRLHKDPFLPEMMEISLRRASARAQAKT